MKFGPVPTSKAEGAFLAHSVTAGGTRFKKGRRLSGEDIALLSDAGLQEVTVARLEDGDVHEDEAAERLAHALGGDGVKVSAPFTGRANLFADANGLVLFDREAIDAVNAVDEAITVATLSQHARVGARQMIATVKIIPFGVAGRDLDQALSAARPLSVAPFVPKKVALISTTLSGMKKKLLDKNAEIMGARLASLGSELSADTRVPHEEAPLAETLAEAAEESDIVLAFGASAIVDRRDVIPAAIERAGGRIVHYGMPVDPGNLLLVGELDGKPVVGLPGCARSPSLNGVDWVLERLCADLTVGPEGIRAMGVGGLLKEVAARPQPREAHPPAAPHAPRVTALILAAGQSRRMGARNKLIEEIAGRPIVAHVARAALESAADHVIAVTGHEPEEVAAVLPEGVETVHNPDFADGLSSSLRVGLAAVADESDAVLILLGDMPDVTPTHIDRLIAAFDEDEGRLICVPVVRGKRANPVLFARRFLPEMMRLKGDAGAKHLIGEYEDDVAEVAIDDEALLADIDDEAALRARRGRQG